jgi:hypothetical protein
VGCRFALPDLREVDRIPWRSVKQALSQHQGFLGDWYWWDIDGPLIGHCRTMPILGILEEFDKPD